LADLDLAVPPPSVDLADIRRKYHAAVADGKIAPKQKGAGKA
jgi:hypothetical protein